MNRVADLQIAITLIENYLDESYEASEREEPGVAEWIAQGERVIETLRHIRDEEVGHTHG